MFSFRDDEELKRAIVHFCETERPGAAYYHGTSALVDVKLAAAPTSSPARP
jgi:hypothetical protein